MHNEIIIILGTSCFLLGVIIGSLLSLFWAGAITQRKCQRAAREAWKQARGYEAPKTGVQP